MIKKYLYILFILLFLLLLSNCSTRNETPLINDETGLISYPSSDANGINADIIFYSGTEEHTGLPIVANVFELNNKAKVYASVKLYNYEFHRDNDLMFHIDWLDPGGNSIFKKRVDVLHNDSSAEIKSAISIPPGKRDTGNYKFRVYLFRELIAENNFMLASYNIDSASVFSKDNSQMISAEINLDTKHKRKKGLHAEQSSIFQIKDKGKIYADINLLNRSVFIGKKLSGEISWVDSNDSTIFNRPFYIPAKDSSSTLKSAISVNNNSRKPGIYGLKIFLFGKQIGRKTFELISERKDEIKVGKIKDINADISFFGRYNKKTKTYFAANNKFTIKDKRKVYAQINIKGSGAKKDNSAKIRVEWIGSGKNSFYKKIFKYPSRKDSTIFHTAISISPPKRIPGEYKCRVYYNSNLICEKKFELLQSNK